VHPALDALLVHGSPVIAVQARGLTPRTVLLSVTPTVLLLLALLLVPLINYWGLLLLLLEQVTGRLIGPRAAETAR
jgi:hypothetical protein